MSGIFNLVLTSFGGAAAPVGTLARLTDTAGAQSLNTPRITIRNDALTFVAETFNNLNGTFTPVICLARMPLSLDSFTWQTRVAPLPRATTAAYPYAVTTDSTGAVIVAGAFVSSSVPRPYLLKVSNTGAYVYQVYINLDSTFYGVTVDGGDSIYAVGNGEWFFSSRDDVVYAKFLAGGSLSWHRGFADTSPTATPGFGRGIAMLNASTVAVASQVQITAGGQFTGAILRAASSDGARIAADGQDAGTRNAFGEAVISGEAAGTIYNAILSEPGPGSLRSITLLKYTTAGGFVWQRTLTDTTASFTETFLCMDPSLTHVYVCGVITLDTRAQIQIAKYTINGVLVWIRSISSPTLGLTEARIQTDSLDNIYVSFRTNANSASLICKMPGSGAGSGNFATLAGARYDYGTPTTTDSAGTVGIFTNNRPLQTAPGGLVSPSADAALTGVYATATAPI
jgi:hypothetical protein